ncbi:MAG: hypothetical protein KAT14_02665, partial [Candidatus Marinimicrobia bacterium]|nr:hypothetical protein [Candidatus Neomarinimicrobiota bacterium]
MRRILSIMMLILISSLFADELPEYIAQFDKSLAIQLYRDKLQEEGSQSKIYYSLARLYQQTGQTGLAEDCYWHLLQLHNDAPEVYQDYLDFLYNAGYYTQVKRLIKEKHFTQEWGEILLARSYF